jgi:type IV pilus assembly protein PilA
LRDKQRGFSLIELLIVVGIILVIAAIAIPNLLRARASANEASAVGTLRTINTACQNYASSYGIGYPAALDNLGPAAVPSSTSADLLDAVVIGGSKSGYSFVYVAGTPVNGIINTYTITADPLSRGNSGVRGFFTYQSLVIRNNANGTATVSDPPLS